MATETPRIDTRSYDEIVADTSALTVAYTRPQPGDPESWRGWTPTKGTSELGGTLMQLFSRMVTRAVERLNQVPEKNHLAFLNLLGAQRTPPRPAKVPLTFRPTPGSTRTVIVPAGTQVGAKADGPLPEAVFETDLELTLSRAQLAAVYVRTPAEDAFVDHTAQATGTSTVQSGFNAFVARDPVGHALYLACDPLFTLDGVQALSVTLQANALTPWRDLPLSWSFWDGAAWRTLDRSPSWQVWKTTDSSPPDWHPRIGFSRIQGLEVHCPGDTNTGDLLAHQVRVSPGVGYDAQALELKLEEARILDLSTLAQSLDDEGQEYRIFLILLGYGELSPELRVVPEADVGHYPEGTWLRLARLTVFAASSEKPVARAVEYTTTDRSLTVRIPLPPALQPCEIEGITARWLRASLSGLLPLEPDPTLRMPAGVTARAGVEVKRQELAVTQAFANTVALDLSKDFCPLGERPRFNDTFYLASVDAFSQAGASVSLDVTLTEEQPVGAASTDLKIAWEVWNGKAWLEVGRTSPTGPIAAPGQTSPRSDFYDDTKAFTSSGQIRLILPAQTAPAAVEGRTGYWIRVRILGGKFGTDASFDTTTSTWSAAVSQPPWIKSISLSVVAKITADLQACVQENDGERIDVSTMSRPGNAGFTPFLRGGDVRPALYLGFDRPLENRAISLYLDVLAPRPDEIHARDFDGPDSQTDGNAPESSPTEPALPPRIAWEVQGVNGWTALEVEDDTRALTSSGLVRFIGPTNPQAATAFGQRLWWLRVRWVKGTYPVSPRLGRILLNTTWGTHATTRQRELLGSSDGSPNQSFQVSQLPVLEGQRLEVCESEVPVNSSVYGNQSDIAYTVEAAEAEGQASRIWVEWQPVPDFYASGPDDRHYLLDPVSGRVAFGDGQRGKVPPSGQNNLRMAWYRAGGGSHGDRAVGAVTELKTAIPSLESVTNHIAATGGADLESLERAKDRSARALRHRERAVTVQDFEDLALDASPAIARTRAIPPQFDPIEQNDGARPDAARGIGTVLLVIVPTGQEQTPTPTVELLRQVEAYLTPRCAPALRFRVAGPLWAEVRIIAKLSPVSPELGNTVLQRAQEVLDAWLHPLTGGTEGTGWPFGRRPYDSDVYRLLARIEGVDHIQALRIECPAIPENPNVLTADQRRPLAWNLVYSGAHTLELADAAGEG